MTKTLVETTLGKPTEYIDQYQPNLLDPIPRELGRKIIGLTDSALPFVGVDIWNAYELSWLDKNGLPKVAIAEWRLLCTSPNLIESKSIKLYLNSFNMTRFNDVDLVRSTIIQDLSKAAQAPVEITLIMPEQFQYLKLSKFEGKCIDDLSVTIDEYIPHADLLFVETHPVEEKLVSHLLKSNCPITHQPDWASVFISYQGNKINHEGLLKYIVSFRKHNGFHEQCVEKIFVDIMLRCHPQQLTVYARYTRRGGLDINPFRTNSNNLPENFRLARQ